jgi:hypothetical protein
MNWFTNLVTAWLVLGFILTLRGIYLVERKRDPRPVNFLLKTCPNRYKFTVFTAIMMVIAGSTGGMALVPVLAVNYVVGFVQRAFVGRWIRKNVVVAPPGYDRLK